MRLFVVPASTPAAPRHPRLRLRFALTGMLALLGLAASALIAAAEPGTSDLSSPESALGLLAPLGDAPDRIEDPAASDLSLLHQLTVEACRVTDAGCEPVETFTSGSPGEGKLRVDRGGEAYRFTWRGREHGAGDGDTFRFTFRAAGLALGSEELAYSADRAEQRDGAFAPNSVTRVAFRVEPHPAIRVRSLHDARRTVHQSWDALTGEFPDLTVGDRYRLLHADLREYDTVVPYRDWFGTEEIRCRTFHVTYDDGHDDGGTWCGPGDRVTPETFVRLHVPALQVTCAGLPGKEPGRTGASDLAGHEIVRWDIEFHDGERCGSAGEAGLAASTIAATDLLDPEEPYTADELGEVLTSPDHGGLDAAGAAATLAEDFTALEVVNALVRSPHVDPTAEELVEIAEDILGVTTATEAAALLASATDADGEAAFDAADITEALTSTLTDDLAEVLDALAGDFDAIEAIQGLADAGATEVEALVAAIRAHEYAMTDLVAAIEDVYHDGDVIPGADWVAAQQQTITGECTAPGVDLSTATSRDGIARMLVRAFVEDGRIDALTGAAGLLDSHCETITHLQILHVLLSGQGWPSTPAADMLDDVLEQTLEVDPVDDVPPGLALLRQAATSAGDARYTPTDVVVAYRSVTGELGHPEALDAVHVAGYGAAEGLAAARGAIGLGTFTSRAAADAVIRSHGYEPTALLTAMVDVFEFASADDARAVLFERAAAIVPAECGDLDAAQRAEVARQLQRALVTPAQATGILAGAGCDATAVQTAEVLRSASPGVESSTVVGLLADEGLPLAGDGGIAEAALEVLGLSPRRAAEALADAGFGTREVLDGLFGAGAGLSALVGWLGEGETVDAGLARSVAALLASLAGDFDIPLSELVDGLVDGLGGPAAVPPCLPVVGFDSAGHDPVALLSDVDRRYPSLYGTSDPGALQDLAACLDGEGLDFPAPLRRVDIEFTRYLPPRTTLPVPRGVFVGQVSLSAPVLGFSLPFLPVYVSDHTGDSAFYDGGAKYGFLPWHRSSVDLGGIAQWPSLQGSNPTSLVFPKLPSGLPLPEIRLRAAFYTDPMLACLGGSRAAGMAAAAIIDPFVYPKAVQDLMARGSTVVSPSSRTLRIHTPGYTDKGCGRIVYNDGASSGDWGDKPHATVSMTVGSANSIADATLVSVPDVSHDGTTYGVSQTAGYVPTGPELLLLLANAGHVPESGTALASYLRG